jgi:PKD repeat protein
VQVVKNVAANQMLKLVEPTSGPSITSVSVNKASAVEDEVLTFNGVTSGSVQKYSWDFNGDGIEDWSSTSSPGPVTYAYTTSGVFNARLTVLDSSGLLGAYESTSFVTVTNVPPTPEAGSDVSVIEDEYADFNASGSTDTPSDIFNLTFKWDFGDGTITGWNSTPGASHNYTTDGQYTVTLTVGDDDGSEQTDTLTVTVNNQAPEADAGDDKLVAEDVEVSLEGFGNDTISDVLNLLFKWDFGDGSSQTSWNFDGSAAHTYEQMGDYTVTLSVNDGDVTTTDTANVTVYNPVPESYVMENKSVDEDTPLAFTGWGTDNPSDRLDLNYNWNFGDGSSSGWLAVSPNTTHIYTEAGVYNATLVVRDGDLATGNATVVVTVNNVAPTAKAGLDIDAEEDEEVYFEGSGSDTDSDISTLEFRWDFGDGSPATTWSTSPSTNHTYTEEGSYKVTLIVRDNNLEEAEDNLYVTVENVEPRADISAESTRIDENDVINFSAVKSTDTMSDIDSLNYTWEFENGVFDYGMTASYRFINKGTYDVTLTVEDDDGARDMDAVTITVNNVNPTAKFSIFKEDETTPANLVFNADEELFFDSNGTMDTPNDLGSLSYVWDFGDGNTSTGLTATHKYTSNGEYKVRLTVMDDNNEMSNAIIVITVEGAEPEGGTGTETEEKGVALTTILAVIVIAVLAALLGTFVLFRKKFGKREPEESDVQEGVIAQPGQLEAGMVQPGMSFMEGEMVQGEMPGQAVYQGEAVLPEQTGIPEQIKPPFCGQCGGKTDLNSETSEWFCTNCNITVPGPIVPPGWMPEHTEEQPQMDKQEEVLQLPEGEKPEVEDEDMGEGEKEGDVPEGEGDEEEEEGLFGFKKPGEGIDSDNELDN